WRTGPLAWPEPTRHIVCQTWFQSTPPSGEDEMSTRIAINGFGRIGRLVFRALYTQGLFGKDIEVVAVGDIVPADNLAYLLKYDSIQGKFEGKVDSKKASPDKTEDVGLLVEEKEVE